MNFLASPPLVVAYAIAGNMQIDLYKDPLGEDNHGNPVYLKDIWPSTQEVHDTVTNNIDSSMFRSSYDNVFKGDERWRSIKVPEGNSYAWNMSSTYIQNPPYFEDMTMEPRGIPEIRGARVLALLGDNITTDHISPAGSIQEDSPAGSYLNEHQIPKAQFNSYGARRGNHEVMMRGTFANVRLRNQLAPGSEGCWTLHKPSGDKMTIYDAAMRYKKEGTPLIVIGGSSYGNGSSPRLGG